VTENLFGTGETSYYLFEPADPIPASAPVIVLMHGYTDLTPVKSQPWIDHLVKRGNIVIYPVYQAYANSTGENFVSNALKATGAALEQLRSMNKIRAETDNLSVMGYSAGGVVAVNYATLAQENGLPVPKVLYLIAPGGAVGFGLSFGQYKLEIPNFRLPETTDLGKIAPATRMVIFTGDRDIVVGDVAAKYIWQNTGQIPADNKAFLRLNSDNHGSPALVADHGVGNRGVPDALNFYGTWKVFDALQNCALNNKECDIALTDTPAQRYMGKWSDGQPVKELTPIKNP
jgi:pimeloyl-ACP methyl ester carboxylesterase